MQGKYDLESSSKWETQIFNRNLLFLPIRLPISFAFSLLSLFALQILVYWYMGNYMGK